MQRNKDLGVCLPGIPFVQGTDMSMLASTISDFFYLARQDFRTDLPAGEALSRKAMLVGGGIYQTILETPR
jgi:hypothetical protein